jgi:hypothetical protein
MGTYFKEAADGDPSPDEFHYAERPRASQESVDTRQKATTRKREDESVVSPF